jgi:hypothetical protein
MAAEEEPVEGPVSSRRDATRMRPRSTAQVLGAAALFVAVAGLFQLLTPAPWDGDTAYHVAVGRLLAEHGMLRAFPWTPYSWLSDHYADKELLFHLLLAPLTPLGWIPAAKIVGAALGGLALLVLFLVLRAEGVPRPAIWALVPLAASGAFVFRFALVRPHLLSIALALAVAWGAVRGRHVLVAAAALLYPWCYIAWHMPLVLVALVELARLMSGRRVEWRPGAAAALGLVLGLLVHPNAVNLVRFWWLVHVDILARTAWGGREGFQLGSEFHPFAPIEFLRFALLPALMAGAAAVLAWRDRARDAAPLALSLAALGYLALTVASSRFIEYLAPFAAAALALALRERGQRVAVATLAVAFVFTAALGARPVLALGTRGDDLPPTLGAYLRSHIPPGDQVFTCDWGLTGALLWALPDRRFMVALDPVLFHAKDPERYRLWADLPTSAPPDARTRIREAFGARWVLCFGLERNRPLLRRLHADPGGRALLESPLWYLYDLDPGTRAGF